MAGHPLGDVAANMLVAFGEESVREATGASKRRWALLLLALILGVAGGVYLARRLAPRTDVHDPNVALARAIEGQ